MVVRDFNRWQSIFLSFRFILSNTTRLAPFPYGDTRIQGSAKAQHMPAMIVQADLDHYLGQSTYTHSLRSSITNNEAGKDALMLLA